jgi:hypothetical protein
VITIYDLKPHRNYTFTLVVRSGTESSYLRVSNPLSASFTTSESYPGKVEKFHPVDIQPGDITFTWSLPSQEQNGIIRKFSITYRLEVKYIFLWKYFRKIHLFIQYKKMYETSTIAENQTVSSENKS